MSLKRSIKAVLLTEQLFCVSIISDGLNLYNKGRFPAYLWDQKYLFVQPHCYHAWIYIYT